MNKYNGLLSGVAQKYYIRKGERESENEWKTRLVYSICGMMAYASLWDDSEEEPISIIHLKTKVRSMLANYRSIYPELDVSLPYIHEELEDEIANLFLSAGVVYHRPNRIAPSIYNEKVFDTICFQRGISLDSISCVSGIGFYSVQRGSSNSKDIQMMFGLESEHLSSLWEETVSSAIWQKNVLLEQNTEYLRLRAPFSQGYWVNNPDTSDRVSILRTGMKGSQLYYLYHYTKSTLEVSPLPQWKVESYNYRTLANACLSSYGALPPIEYSEDGALIHLRMNYLLPPRELEFVKLYSWPEVCTALPCNFKRKLSKEVFNAIKAILSDEGYAFKKGAV